MNEDDINRREEIMNEKVDDVCDRERVYEYCVY